MLWKFLIGTLVLSSCLGIEAVSATSLKGVEIPSRYEGLELLSNESEQLGTEEKNYKISHHKRRYRKRHHYKRRTYQRRNYHPNYRRVNYRDNYQDCPDYRRRRSNYRPRYYRPETYPMNDMIYRRHYYRRH